MILNDTRIPDGSDPFSDYENGDDFAGYVSGPVECLIFGVLFAITAGSLGLFVAALLGTRPFGVA